MTGILVRMRTMIVPKARLLLPLALPFMLGCAFRTPTPHVPMEIAGDAAPPARFDVAEVKVVARSGTIDAETAAEVRAQTKKILGDAARKSSTGGGSSWVRVRVELGDYIDYASRAMNTDGMAVLPYALLAPAGVTFDRQVLSVDLTITRGGRTFVGHGSADKRGSIYAPARKRALAVALDQALASAAATASSP